MTEFYDTIMMQIESIKDEINDPTQTDIDKGYYRMLCAEIHGAICVFQSKLSQNEIDTLSESLDYILFLTGSSIDQMSNFFYMCDWKN